MLYVYELEGLKEGRKKRYLFYFISSIGHWQYNN